MKFSPNNFYIGIIDLFAIILPGCIVSLTVYYFYHLEVNNSLKSTGQSEFLSAFILLFSSYIFGHIISQLSAYLDKWVYDRFKDKIYKNQTLLNLVKQIRTEIYGNSSEDLKLVSSYEWTEMKLHKELPQAVQEAERYVADSKFFRSLLLILFILTIPLLIIGKYLLALICFLISGFSLVRYFHKRQKATKTLYKGIIFMEKLNNPQKKVISEVVFNEE